MPTSSSPFLNWNGMRPKFRVVNALVEGRMSATQQFFNEYAAELLDDTVFKSVRVRRQDDTNTYENRGFQGHCQQKSRQLNRD